VGEQERREDELRGREMAREEERLVLEGNG
jgi:hypothetical protein